MGSGERKRRYVVQYQGERLGAYASAAEAALVYARAAAGMPQQTFCGGGDAPPPATDADRPHLTKRLHKKYYVIVDD